MHGRPAQAPGRVVRDRAGAGRGPGRHLRSSTGRPRACPRSSRCPMRGLSLPSWSRALFSFNSPARRLPDLPRPWRDAELDPARVVPDPTCRSPTARCGWDRRNYEASTLVRARASTSAFGRDAVAGARRRAAQPVPVRHDGHESLSRTRPAGRRRQYRVRSKASWPNLERRYRETESSRCARSSPKYMSDAPCSRARRAPQPERAARSRSRDQHHVATRRSARRCSLRAPAADEAGAARSPRRSSRRSASGCVPQRRRPRLPHARPRGQHALRRRGPAHPAGQRRSAPAGRRAVHPRRAVDRPAPARQRRACSHAHACATSATP